MKYKNCLELDFIDPCPSCRKEYDIAQCYMIYISKSIEDLSYNRENLKHYLNYLINSFHRDTKRLEFVININFPQYIDLFNVVKLLK
jgi:hypothetical protein